MNNNDILNKYIDLIDKGYCCACNELNCIDNFPQTKITHAIKKLQQENKQLKDLIDTILTFSFFKEECPLNFSFEDNSKEDKAQNIFYSDEYCENNCNSIYKECWLKYFKELQGIDSDE